MTNQTYAQGREITPEYIRAFHVCIKRGEGAIAYYAGKSIFDCPYNPETDQDFYDAWVDAYISTEKKYDTKGYLKAL